MLSVHGPHRSYLVRFGLDDDDTCRLCLEEKETAEHLLYNCKKFADIQCNDIKQLQQKEKLISIELYKKTGIY